MINLPACEHLILKLDNTILHLTLNRPHKKNAMSAQTVAEIGAVVDAIADSREVRGVVLSGSEGNFCAGGDISGMQDSNPTTNQERNVDAVNRSAKSRNASWDYNRSFGRLITQVNRAPQVVICLLEGAVLGGGFGLACVSDVAIADANSLFAMPETGLGIIPAQIAPFVVARIGITQARRLALLGVRINGQQAMDIGVVHQVVQGSAEMASALDKTLALLRKCAPNANAITKALMLDVEENRHDHESLLDRAADDFASALNGPEGKEGTRAFIQKNKPSWQT
jgi:isohexenylglutaconyl-CoA hydratase